MSFVPTNQQTKYQRQAIAHLSTEEMERELRRCGCEWIEVTAPPEGFYRIADATTPDHWHKARQIVRGNEVVGMLEGGASLRRVLHSALAHARAQDEFRDRNDWPPGMEPPKGPVPEPWSDVWQGQRWLIWYYQDVMTFERRPDSLRSFDELMGEVESWRRGRNSTTNGSILLQEFEVVAFAERDAVFGESGSVFYFSKPLTGPSDRIVWPGGSTWIDAPVGKVAFFFLPEYYWQRHIERETTHNPPTVDLKWPWKRHVGVEVE